MSSLKTTIYFILLLLFHTAIYAQPYLDPHYLISDNVEIGLAFMELGDIDNDQDLDLVVTHFEENKLYYIENYGDSSYSELQIISDNINKADDVLLVDYNKDNLLDIVVSGRSEISIFKNTGNNQFLLTKFFGINLYNFKIKAADIDDDNDLDLIISGKSVSGSNDIVAYSRNLGSDQFSPFFIAFSEDVAINSLDIGNINNDNFPDIVFTAGKTNNIRYLENNPTAGFNNATVIGNANFPVSLTLNDIDKDGDLDIAVGGRSGEVYTIENSGNAVFQPSVQHGSTNTWISKIEVIDYDDDGLRDVLTVDLDNGEIIFFKNNGSGFDNPQILISDGYGANDFEYVQKKNSLYDFYIPAINGELSKHFGTSQTNFIKTEVIRNEVFSNLSTTQVIDLNLDGENDIVSLIDGNLYWVKNISRRQYLNPQRLMNTPINLSGFVIDNVDQDPSKEIVAWNESNDALYLIQLDTVNVVSYSVLSNNKDRPYRVKIADMNNDNKNDIVVYYRGESELGVFYSNSANQSFSYSIIENNMTSNTEFEIADMDGDGDKDIVAIIYSDYEIALYKNNSNSFTRSAIGGVYFSPTFVEVGDLDNDGDYDVLFNEYNSFDDYDYHVAENINNTATFSLKRIKSNEIEYEEVSIHNVSGNGTNEIVFLNGNRIEYLTNTGNLTYSNPAILKNLEGLSDEYKLVDLDNDTDKDILVTSREDKLYYYENDAIFYNIINVTACDSLVSNTQNVYKTSGRYIEQRNGGTDDILLHIPQIDTTLTRTNLILSSNETDADSYQWIFCGDSVIKNATNRAHTVDTNGFYQVIINKDGCIDTSECIQVANVSLRENNNNVQQLTLFPNPTSEYVNLPFTAIQKEQLNLTDVNGKSYKIVINNDQLNVSHLSTGIYFLSIQNNEKVYYSKIVKL